MKIKNRLLLSICRRKESVFYVSSSVPPEPAARGRTLPTHRRDRSDDLSSDSSPGDHSTFGSHQYSGVPDADNPVRTVPSTGWSPRCRNSGNRAGVDIHIFNFPMCTDASRRHRSRTDRAGYRSFRSGIPRGTPIYRNLSSHLQRSAFRS